MEIKEAKYLQFDGKNTTVFVTTKDGRAISVPMDENNRDYVEILEQVKEGTLTIKDAE